MSSHITHYVTFEDINSRDIPNCEIGAGEGVKAAGAFENSTSDWIQINEVRLIVVRLDSNNRWEYYGAYSWNGAVAVKPDRLYDARTNAATFPKGVYGLMNFSLEVSPQTGGLYYQDGPFDLVFSR